jgi:phosphoribosylformylglycinamidine (FGAM) synthase-like amidotransferase family enzyme
MTCCMSAQVAILRTEGTNGDREMTGSFYNAGFEAWCGVRCVLLGGRFD